MGQKTNPNSVRLALTKNWKSKWFASASDFAKFLYSDYKIRQEIFKNYGTNAGISDIIIERTHQEIIINIETSKPGILIGRQGKGVENIQKALQKLVRQKIKLNIIEIKKPDLLASLVAANIGYQITHRRPYKRAARQAAERVMQSGAKGVKITISGRLNGADIARRESLTFGTIPTSSLKKNIDFAIFHAPTTYGIIGIKVWIHKGELKTDEENKVVRPII